MWRLLKRRVVEAAVEEDSVEVPEAILRRLLDYCRANDWAGYDPYDALNSRIFQVLPFLDCRIPRLVLTQVLKNSPINLRPALLIPKTENPKAIALFLTAFVKLSRLGWHGVEADLITAMISKLVASRSRDIPYWCWGYSFPWQTRTKLVAKGAPNLVCTSFVGNALLDAYGCSQDSQYLRMAMSASEYLLDDLYWTGGDVTGSFAYPLPSSRTPIHNANFLGAALLCRVYRHARERTEFLDAALSVARYSAAKQLRDGAWNYGESEKQRWIDNFHTGYNLCALRSIANYAETSEFDSHIREGFRFYRNHFFAQNSAPKYFHNRTYPIDVHCVAQSIVTLLTFKDMDRDGARLAYAVYEWAVKNLWTRDGFFGYRTFPVYKISIPYMRWSQAWMVLALSTLIEHSAKAAEGAC